MIAGLSLFTRRRSARIGRLRCCEKVRSHRRLRELGKSVSGDRPNSFSPPPVLDRKRRHPACRSLPASLPRIGLEPDLFPETRSRQGCPRLRRLRKIQSGRRRTQIFFFTEARHPSHTGRTNAWVPNNGTFGPPDFQPLNTSLDFRFSSFAMHSTKHGIHRANPSSSIACSLIWLVLLLRPSSSFCLSISGGNRTEDEHHPGSAPRLARRLPMVP